MKEELIKQLMPIIKLAQEGIVAGVNIAQQQVPELIKQLLMWKVTAAYIWISIAGIGILLVILLFAMAIKYDDDGIITTVASVASVAFFGWFIVICVNVFTIAKISVAPKLYLVQYISNMMK